MMGSEGQLKSSTKALYLFRVDTENGSLATRNLLVLVNPFSGRKKATAMYKEKVKPMLFEAEIKHTVQNTGNMMKIVD